MQLSAAPTTTNTLFDAATNNSPPAERVPYARIRGRSRSTAPYFLTQKLLPFLAEGGAIVNTTSNAALATGLEPGYSAYASMKGGLTVLTRYMAKELSGRRIRVNSVAPGPTRTRIANNAFEQFPEVIPPIVARTALGRLGDGDDVGKVIDALLSDECGWITGENIEVSGGFNL
jgi:NAD(P)-dependent dehydrogenase (short-subunit alcohol dehydrogenase family)